MRLSKCGENNRFCSHHILTSSVYRLEYTCTENGIYLFYIIFIQTFQPIRARVRFNDVINLCTVITHGCSTNQSARHIPNIIFKKNYVLSVRKEKYEVCTGNIGKTSPSPRYSPAVVRKQATYFKLLTRTS